MAFKLQAKQPSKLSLFTEPTRAIFGLGLYAVSNKRIAKALPRGDGHPVMVLPGFAASDNSTYPIRKFLDSIGYQSLTWDEGINLGKTFYIYRIIERVQQIHAETGRKVSLVGWSLGGVYAREIARQAPEHIRQVITLGSPFGGLFEHNNIRWLHELIHGKSYQKIPDGLLDDILVSPPVPTTAIFSKEDGVVPWEYCKERTEDEHTQNIRVSGSHFGLGHNPAVLYCVGDRLAQPEGQWQHFSPQGVWSLLFPEFVNK
jgi:hypothetical protein